MKQTNKFVTVITKERKPGSAVGNPRPCFAAGQHFATLQEAMDYLYPVCAQSTAARRVKSLPDFRFTNEKQNKAAQ